MLFLFKVVKATCPFLIDDILMVPVLDGDVQTEPMKL